MILDGGLAAPVGIWPTHIKPGKRTVKRAKRRMRKTAKVYQTNRGILKRAKASLQSFKGYIIHCSGHKTMRSVFKKAVFLPRKKESKKNIDKNSE
jgi:hypothetical protein